MNHKMMQQLRCLAAWCVVVLFSFALFSCAGSTKPETAASTTAEQKSYPDPARMEADVVALLEQTEKSQLPAPPYLLSYGSSSLRMWNDSISADLGLPVIAHGFGGSTMNDAVHIADRLVIPFKPAAVLLYEGDNDIGQGISPAQVHEAFLQFVNAMHEELPNTKIYVLSIKPSPSRWHLWPLMQEANRLLAETCAEDPLLVYIDVATPMLGANGEPMADLFVEDRLHMTEKGYEIWRRVIREAFEKDPPLRR